MGGSVQLLEGGTSTTFQVDFEDNFYTTLQAASSYMAITNPSFFAGITITRDSTAVSWETDSDSRAWRDRSPEFEISFSGSAVNTQYYDGSSGHVYPTSREDRLWFNIPVGGGFNYVAPGSFPFASYPLTFTIKAKSDTSYREERESIRVSFALFVNGETASWSPQFQILDTLTFDLVDVTPDPTGKPTTPANLMAAAGKGAVTLAWDAIDDTSSNTNLLNDILITKHQYRQSTDGDISDETWTDIPNSAPGEANDTSYTIDGLADGTEYTIQVRAVNACDTTAGCGNSDPATAVMSTPDAGGLARPAGLTATAGNTTVMLRWDDPNDDTILAYDYQEKAGTQDFGEWTELPVSSVADHTHRFTGLDNGTRYAWRIRARTSVKTSLASDAATATPQGAVPAAIALTVTPRHGGVTLSWPNPHDPTIEEYEYQYKTGSGIYGLWTEIEETNVEGYDITRAPHVDTSGATIRVGLGRLTNGTAHTFRVRAHNADGDTTSNEVTVTPAAVAPARPTGLQTWTESGRRFLQWDHPRDRSITGYEYSTDGGRTWSTFLINPDIANTDARMRNLYAAQGNLTRGEFVSGRHAFHVRAKNANGYSPASDAAMVQGGVRGEAANNVRLEWDSGTGRATLVWDATENEGLKWWHIRFYDNTALQELYDDAANNQYGVNLRIGVTRLEIPGTLTSGTAFKVTVEGCPEPSCISTFNRGNVPFALGVPVPTGVTATPGDEQVRLSWDDPGDSDITKYQYNLALPTRDPNASNWIDIPDGDDADTNPGNETSHTITTGLTNGERYTIYLRAVKSSTNGVEARADPEVVVPLATGVPAAPSGLRVLMSAVGEDSHGHGAHVHRLVTWEAAQDGSITKYEQGTPRDNGEIVWRDVPDSDAFTTGFVFTTRPTALYIRAVNANGVGPSAHLESSSFETSPPPPKPAGLRAVAGNGSVTLSWDDPGNSVYINGYRYTTDGGDSWIDIPDSQTTGQGQLTRYTVSDLTNGQAYTFNLLAFNGVAAGGAVTFRTAVSDAVTATPQGGAPAQPTGLAAEAGNAQATLTWDDPGDASITKYQIKQDAAAWADISGSSASTTSHTAETLTNGTAYTFQIRAVNDHDGDSTDDPGTASDTVTVTPGVPAAPASLVTAAGNAQVTLTWTAPASDNGSAVTGYEYTSNADAATPAWTDVPDSGSDGRADETEYTVSSLDNNTTYAFAVRAENANGPGAATPTLRATPAHPDAPPRPIDFAAAPGHERVRLSWTAPANASLVLTSYQYRQSTDGARVGARTGPRSPAATRPPPSTCSADWPTARPTPSSSAR